MQKYANDIKKEVFLAKIRRMRKCEMFIAKVRKMRESEFLQAVLKNMEQIFRLNTNY